MTINQNLLMAILSMDSYNRGYGFGIKGLSSSGIIGNVTIKTLDQDGIDAQTYSNWQTAGFYAIAYTLPAGAAAGVDAATTVISYRGSDDIPGFGGAFTDFITGRATTSDAQNGFGIALGSPYGPQATLALQFYRAVTAANPNASTILTGHSLGGGLAGFVAAVAHKQAIYSGIVMFTNNNILNRPSAVQIQGAMVADPKVLEQLRGVQAA